MQTRRSAWLMAMLLSAGLGPAAIGGAAEPWPTPTAVPRLRVNVSPSSPKLLGPLAINIDVDPLYGGRVVDAWGAIFLAGGGIRYLTGAPPCSVSAVPAPIARGVVLPNGYSGNVLSVGSIPLGYDGSHRVVIGLTDAGVPPVPVSPYNFLDPPRYWDERIFNVRTF